MSSLQKKTEAGLLTPFQFVELNGLCLPSPHHAYCVLLEALTGERLGPKAASAALNEIFSGQNTKSRRHTIVLLDELDSLVNRTQTILYNLFDWPSRPNSSLSIIAIANTMDLPERLHLRIGSRLAGNRLLFRPYNREQLETIMKARIKNISSFEDNAITLIARKVANCSGDLRRCLELCRRALEISNAAASSRRNIKVSVSYVSYCLNDSP